MKRIVASGLAAYGVAAVAVIVTVAVSWFLAPYSQGRTAFLPLLPAVIFSAWYGGLGPGLFATFLAALLGDLFLLESPGSLKIVHLYDWMRLILFMMAGVLVSILSQLLLRAKQRAETSEQQFRLVVDGARDYAIILLDAEGRVARWNAGAQRIIGYSAEEIIGQPYSRFFNAEDVAEDKPQKLLERAGREGRCEDEGRRVRKDGSTFWADAIITAIRGEEGTLRGFAKVTRDMTERHETLVKLKKAEEVAEDARRARQFIAVLSHELRTPLTPMLAATAALEADEQVPRRVRDDLRMIRRNAELEARLVDDLLNWSRTLSGKLNLHFETVDVHAAVKDALQLCQQEIAQKHLDVRLELQAANVHVWADPARFRQIVWNLLKNACQYSFDDGQITVTTVNEEDRLVLQVEDRGSGIEPQQLPHIFDAYYQGGAATARPYAGLGLGLSLSKALVEAQGGTVTAASEGYNQGATFTVRLPLVKAQVNAGMAVASMGKAEKPSGGQRVLLVEDNADTCRIMSRVLRSYGYAVTTAGSVAEALKAIESGEFDLLLSDLGLPDGTGWDLMRQISANRPMKAIAVSGYGTEADIQSSKEAGFQAHLTKPLDLAKLDEAIRQLCA